MESLRTIKRYANRKLYDLKESRYVTLEEIAGFIRAGEEIRVIESGTNEDLTSLTMTQILFEEEKKNRRLLPLSTLKSMIRSGEEFFQKKIASPVTTIKEEAERKMATFRDEAEKTFQRMVGLDRLDDVKGLARAYVDSTQGFFEEVQKELDGRFQIVMDMVSSFTKWKQDLEDLTGRVAGLEERLIAMEKDKAPAKPRRRTRKSPAKTKKEE